MGGSEGGRGGEDEWEGQREGGEGRVREKASGRKHEREGEREEEEGGEEV